MHPGLHRSTRRRFMQLTAGGLFLPWLGSCANEDIIDREPKQNINMDVLWTRRQEWAGKEAVRSVVRMGDRYIMVRGKDPLGWVFPGGLIHADIHGARDKEAHDMRMAAEDYAHSQAMVQVWARQAVIISYGYGIDETDPEMKMIYWIAVTVPTTVLPTPQADLTHTEEAKWVALDHPTLGPCLQRRLDEMVQAREGGTVMINRCYT